MTSRIDFQLTAPEPLVVDLVRWVAAQTRTYRETMDAWRTSCPRLPVWEDALENRFLEVARADGGDELNVAVTPTGLRFLESCRR
jgi:hypothetical protein